jgi:hypothetical protein
MIGLPCVRIISVVVHVSESNREYMQNVDGLESDEILYSADVHMNRLYTHTYCSMENHP